MPTGYTVDIAKGITFEKYALGCARAFGACISMRDDSQDREIPDKFKPSDYHKKTRNNAKEKLEGLEMISLEEAQLRADQEYKDEIARKKSYIEECSDLEQKYRTMLSKVRAWQPPTKDHVEFKNFMEKQIVSSIDFDCDTTYSFKELEKLKRLTGQEWIDKKRKEFLRDIAYHSKEWAKELERVSGRNEWIKALKESLPRQTQ